MLVLVSMYAVLLCTMYPCTYPGTLVSLCVPRFADDVSVILSAAVLRGLPRHLTQRTTASVRRTGFVIRCLL